MKKVKLTLKDFYTGEIFKRTVDITCAMINGSQCWELGNKEQQKIALENWIEEQGNDQHNTILELDSWVIV